MSSSLAKIVIAAGMAAAIAIHVVAPRVGVASRAASPAPPAEPGAPTGVRLIPPPPGMQP